MHSALKLFQVICGKGKVQNREKNGLGLSLLHLNVYVHASQLKKSAQAPFSVPGDKILPIKKILSVRLI